jgi:hypothetical protein
LAVIWCLQINSSHELVFEKAFQRWYRRHAVGFEVEDATKMYE